MSLDDLHARAREELTERRVDRTIWIQAVNESGNDHEKANARYIALRVEQLRRETALPDPPAAETQPQPHAPAASAYGPLPSQSAPARERTKEPAQQKRSPLMAWSMIFFCLFVVTLVAVLILSRHNDNDRRVTPPSSMERTTAPDVPHTDAIQADTAPAPPARQSAARRPLPIRHSPPPALLQPAPASPALIKAVEDVIDQYPYLDTPGDNPWLESVIQWRDAYIKLLNLTPPYALRRAANVVERYRGQGYGICVPDTSSARNLAVDSARHCQNTP